MGSIRYETGYASAYLIDELRYYGQIGQMMHNGIDIIWFETPRQENISIHFIDSYLPLYEIRNILTDNALRNRATLFLLWADMMLPRDGAVYIADDWMEALYTLHRQCIYAYEMIEDYPQIFPVFFRGEGQFRKIEFGDSVPFLQLTTQKVTTHLADFVGEWLVADFSGESGFAHDPAQAVWAQAQLFDAYDLLGILPGADAALVKRAYRYKARKLHPDKNTTPEAHAQMQALNAAYTRIMATKK